MGIEFTGDGYRAVGERLGRCSTVVRKVGGLVGWGLGFQFGPGVGRSGDVETAPTCRRDPLGQEDPVGRSETPGRGPGTD